MLVSGVSYNRSEQGGQTLEPVQPVELMVAGSQKNCFSAIPILPPFRANPPPEKNVTFIRAPDRSAGEQPFF